MTSITPPPTFPARPTSPDQPLTNRDLGTGPEPNFAAILAQVRNGSSVEFDPVAVRVPLHELKTAIAHVFNAFGFFPTASDESGQVDVDSEMQIDAVRDVPQRAPAQIADSEQAGPDLTRPIEVTTSEPSVGRAVPVRVDRQAQLRPTVPANLSLGKDARASPGPVLYGGIAELHRAEQSRDRYGQEVSRSPIWTCSEERDQIRFKIGDCSVELIARLHNLSDDEENRLIAELQAVLEEHGLSLAAATINGMPFATGLLGRND